MEADIIMKKVKKTFQIMNMVTMLLLILPVFLWKKMRAYEYTILNFKFTRNEIWWKNKLFDIFVNDDQDNRIMEK